MIFNDAQRLLRELGERHGIVDAHSALKSASERSYEVTPPWGGTATRYVFSDGSSLELGNHTTSPENMYVRTGGDKG